MQLQAFLATLLVVIAILLPFVLGITAFFKKQLSLTGWKVILVSVIASGALATGYGLINQMIWWQIVIIAAGTSISASGGYDLVKDFVSVIANVKKPVVP